MRSSAYLLAVALLLAGCGGGEPEESGTNDRDLKFVFVSPDPLGVNPFLTMGQTGLEQAAERFGARAMVLESEDPMTREENLRAAVAEAADLIVVLGFEFNDLIPRLAADSPEIEFLIVDQCVDEPPPNVHCALGSSTVPS